MLRFLHLLEWNFEALLCHFQSQYLRLNFPLQPLQNQDHYSYNHLLWDVIVSECLKYFHFLYRSYQSFHPTPHGRHYHNLNFHVINFVVFFGRYKVSLGSPGIQDQHFHYVFAFFQQQYFQNLNLQNLFHYHKYSQLG